MFWSKQMASKGPAPVPAVQDEMVEIRQAAAIVSKRQADRQRAEVQDAKATIEAARQWLRSTGIGEAACRLFEASRPWHAWAKRDDWSNWNALDVTEVEGGGSVVDTTHSSFRRGERKWAFAHTRQQNYMPDDDQSRGTLLVSVDGAEVMKLAVAKGFRDGEPWRSVDVLALDRGLWVSELTEMDVALELHQKRRMADMETARLRDQASKIRL